MRTLLVATVSLAVLVAGCFHDDGGNGGNGDGGNGDGTPAITSVTFVSAPTSGLAGAKPIVCWKVEGSGKIPHTAIHTDTVSRASASAFTAYAGGTFYPNNATAAAEVTLPGTFCTAVTLPLSTPASGKMFLRAHAQITSPGLLSAEERSITVGEAGADVVTAISVVSVASRAPTATGSSNPVKVAANETFVVCWSLAGKGNVTHTAVHWDTASHNEVGTTFQAYPKASYPDNKSAGADAKFAIGKTYCTGLNKAPASGRVFFRAHVIDAAAGTGKLTPEYVVQSVGTATTVTFTSTPPADAAQAGSDFLVCWKVEGVGVIPRTGVANDTTPHAADTNVNAYPGIDYPNNATAANATGYTLPGTFCSTVRAPATPLTQFYIRAFAEHHTGVIVTAERTMLAVV